MINNVSHHKMYADTYYLPWEYPLLKSYITNLLKKYPTALQTSTASTVRPLARKTSRMRLQKTHYQSAAETLFPQSKRSLLNWFCLLGD